MVTSSGRHCRYALTESISGDHKTTLLVAVNKAETRVGEALTFEEDSDALTEIDIAGAFKATLGADFRPHNILRAWNSRGHRAWSDPRNSASQGETSPMPLAEDGATRLQAGHRVYSGEQTRHT